MMSIAVIGLLGWGFGPSGEQVSHYTHYLTNHDKDSSFTIPKFKVKKEEIYRIQINNNSVNNHWVGAGLTIKDSKDDVINEKELEFWHESGSDSDGTWNEGRYYETFHFKASKSEDLSAEIYWDSNSKPKSALRSWKLLVVITRLGTGLVTTYSKYIFWTCAALWFASFMMPSGRSKK